MFPWSSGKTAPAERKKAQRAETPRYQKANLSFKSVFNSENAASIGKSVLAKVAIPAISGAVLYGVSAAASGKFDRGKLGEAIFNGGPKKK